MYLLTDARKSRSYLKKKAGLEQGLVLDQAHLFLTGETFIPGINRPIGEIVHKFLGVTLPRDPFTTAQATLK